MLLQKKPPAGLSGKFIKYCIIFYYLEDVVNEDIF